MPDDFVLSDSSAPSSFSPATDGGAELGGSISLPEAPGPVLAGDGLPDLGELEALAQLGSEQGGDMLAELMRAGDMPDLGDDFDDDAGAPLNAEAALERALAAVDLDDMSEDDLARLEGGDEEEVRTVLKLQEDLRMEGDAGVPGRVSIKVMSPADRVRTVRALDMIRSGTTPGEAFAEAFGGSDGHRPDPFGGGGGGSSEEGDAEGYLDDDGYEAADAEGDAGYGDEGESYNEADDESYAGDDGAEEQGSDAAEPDDTYSEHGTAPLAEVQELEERLGELKHRYESARAVYDPAAGDLLEQMQDVKLDLREARRASDDFGHRQGISHERVLSAHADLIDAPGSSFMEFCEAEIVLAERRHDPMFHSPDWPEKIAQRVQDKYYLGGGANSAFSPRHVSPQVVPPAPHRRVRIPGSPAGIGFASGSLSSETAVAEFDKLSPEWQDAALAEIEKLSRRRR